MNSKTVRIRFPDQNHNKRISELHYSTCVNNHSIAFLTVLGMIVSENCVLIDMNQCAIFTSTKTNNRIIYLTRTHLYSVATKYEFLNAQFIFILNVILIEKYLTFCLFRMNYYLKVLFHSNFIKCIHST